MLETTSYRKPPPLLPVDATADDDTVAYIEAVARGLVGSVVEAFLTANESSLPGIPTTSVGDGGGTVHCNEPMSHVHTYIFFRLH